MKRVDARGLSCPEPVIQTKNTMAETVRRYSPGKTSTCRCPSHYLFNRGYGQRSSIKLIWEKDILWSAACKPVLSKLIQRFF